MAKRRKSYDYYKKIEKATAKGDKEALVELTQKMSRQINQRFYRLERKEKGLTESAYRFAKNETGKEKPRYTTSARKLENMTIKELNEQAVKINQKIKSNTSTLTGLEVTADKRIAGAVKGINKIISEKNAMLPPGAKKHKKMTKKTFSEFIRAGGAELLKNKYLDSEYILEKLRERADRSGFDMDDFVETFNKVDVDSSINKELEEFDRNHFSTRQINQIYKK